MLLQRQNGFRRYWMRFLKTLVVMILPKKASGDDFEIRSAGLDGQHGTSDDLLWDQVMPIELAGEAYLCR
ncbi:MAG: hypothetical protein CMM07_11940 [Rhodopirellula sp.]|nr:hypothetical protein [Rhodopirellula sp.]